MTYQETVPNRVNLVTALEVCEKRSALRNGKVRLDLQDKLHHRLMIMYNCNSNLGTFLSASHDELIYACFFVCLFFCLFVCLFVCKFDSLPCFLPTRYNYGPTFTSLSIPAICKNYTTPVYSLLYSIRYNFQCNYIRTNRRYPKY